MTKIFTLLAVLGFGTTAFLQTNVVNPSFENWSDELAYDSLENWTTSNSETWAVAFDPNCWQDDTDPQDGSYSMYMETIIEYNQFTGMDDTIFGYVVKESAENGLVGFPYTDSVDQFTFWYKCDVMPGDSAIAICQLHKGGTVYAAALWKVGGTVSTWTEAIVAVPGGDTDEPDSLSIGFASSDPFTTGIQAGSSFEVDNVTLQYTAGTTVPTPIPNNSFEDYMTWETEEADDWTSFNNWTFLYGGVSYANETLDGTDGTSAMTLTVTPQNDFFGIATIVSNGEFDLIWGFPYGGDEFIAQPEYMLIDYQYSPSGLDTAACWVQMWNSGGSEVDTIAVYPNNVSTWTTDTIELSFSSAPDSINVTLYAGDQIGSSYKVDNIRFIGGDVGIEPIYLSDAWNVFPNPANQSATVLFEEADNISVINIAGRTVYNNNALYTNKLELNTSDWAEGIYLIQLMNKGKVETKKLVVTH